jgi:hypothetical protein
MTSSLEGFAVAYGWREYMVSAVAEVSVPVPDRGCKQNGTIKH